MSQLFIVIQAKGPWSISAMPIKLIWSATPQEAIETVHITSPTEMRAPLQSFNHSSPSSLVTHATQTGMHMPSQAARFQSSNIAGPSKRKLCIGYSPFIMRKIQNRWHTASGPLSTGLPIIGEGFPEVLILTTYDLTAAILWTTCFLQTTQVVYQPSTKLAVRGNATCGLYNCSPCMTNTYFL